MQGSGGPLGGANGKWPGAAAGWTLPPRACQVPDLQILQLSQHPREALLLLAPGWWVGQAFRAILPFGTQDTVRVSVARAMEHRDGAQASRSSPGLACS